MERSHRVLLIGAVGLAGLVILVLGLAMRPRWSPADVAPKRVLERSRPPEPPRQAKVPESKPKPKPPAFQKTDAAKQGKALHDSTFRDFIKNAVAASRKGDDVTREAMLTGLRRDREKARKLVDDEQARAPDAVHAAALLRLRRDLD